MMERLADWEVRLVAYANGVNGAPFAWGRTDCGYLVRNALRAMYGRDMLRGAGSYRTSLAARRAVPAQGVGAVLRERGFEGVRMAMAQPGDVVLLPGKRLQHMAVLLPAARVLTVTHAGGVCVLRSGAMQWPHEATAWRGPA